MKKLNLNPIIKTINISDLFIGTPNALFSKVAIEKDPYLVSMRKNLKNLPPIEVIDLGNVYSLTNGYHRGSIYMYLGLKKIKAEVY